MERAPQFCSGIFARIVFLYGKMAAAGQTVGQGDSGS